MYSRNYTQVTL